MNPVFYLVVVVALILSACSPSKDTDDLKGEIRSSEKRLKDQIEEMQSQSDQAVGGANISNSSTSTLNREFRFDDEVTFDEHSKAIKNFLIIDAWVEVSGRLVEVNFHVQPIFENGFSEKDLVNANGDQFDTPEVIKYSASNLQLADIIKEVGLSSDMEIRCDSLLVYDVLFSPTIPKGSNTKELRCFGINFKKKLIEEPRL